MNSGIHYTWVTLCFFMMLSWGCVGQTQIEQMMPDGTPEGLVSEPRTTVVKEEESISPSGQEEMVTTDEDELPATRDTLDTLQPSNQGTRREERDQRHPAQVNTFEQPGESVPGVNSPELVSSFPVGGNEENITNGDSQDSSPLAETNLLLEPMPLSKIGEDQETTAKQSEIISDAEMLSAFQEKVAPERRNEMQETDTSLLGDETEVILEDLHSWQMRLPTPSSAVSRASLEERAEQVEDTELGTTPSAQPNRERAGKISVSEPVAFDHVETDNIQSEANTNLKEPQASSSGIETIAIPKHSSKLELPPALGVNPTPNAASLDKTEETRLAPLAHGPNEVAEAPEPVSSMPSLIEKSATVTEAHQAYEISQVPFPGLETLDVPEPSRRSLESAGSRNVAEQEITPGHETEISHNATPVGEEVKEDVESHDIVSFLQNEAEEAESEATYELEREDKMPFSETEAIVLPESLIEPEPNEEHELHGDSRQASSPVATRNPDSQDGLDRGKSNLSQGEAPQHLSETRVGTKSKEESTNEVRVQHSQGSEEEVLMRDDEQLSITSVRESSRSSENEPAEDHRVSLARSEVIAKENGGSEESRPGQNPDEPSLPLESPAKRAVLESLVAEQQSSLGQEASSQYLRKSRKPTSGGEGFTPPKIDRRDSRENEVLTVEDNQIHEIGTIENHSSLRAEVTPQKTFPSLPLTSQPHTQSELVPFGKNRGEGDRPLEPNTNMPMTEHPGACQRGRSHLARHQYQEALFAFSQSIRAYTKEHSSLVEPSKLQDCYRQRAYTYLQLNQPTQALYDINQVLERSNPGAVGRGSDFFFRGRVNVILNVFEQAILDFSEALHVGLTPGKRGYAHFLRGLSYLRLKRMNPGLKDLSNGCQAQYSEACELLEQIL